MKQYPNIDYSSRPASYQEDTGTAQAILKDIKGDARREIARAAIDSGTIDQLPEAIQYRTLDRNLWM